MTYFEFKNLSKEEQKVIVDSWSDSDKYPQDGINENYGKQLVNRGCGLIKHLDTLKEGK